MQNDNTNVNHSTKFQPDKNLDRSKCVQIFLSSGSLVQDSLQPDKKKEIPYRKIKIEISPS